MKLFWSKTSSPSETSLGLLAKILQKGDKEEIEKYLWQPKASHIEYLPITFDMLLKLKRPETISDNLSIYKIESKKKFSLVIFNIPWANDDFKFSPLIIENSTNKIFGVMLPFNEILRLISSKQDKEISELGGSWTMFVIERRFS